MKQLTLPMPSIDVDKLGYFRYGKIDENYLLTNDAGEWIFLSEDDFHSFLKGNITEEHASFEALKSYGFLRQDLDTEDLATKIRRKKHFLGQGPHLHIVITTLRCNQSCKYCHASRTSMDRVDTIFGGNKVVLIVITVIDGIKLPIFGGIK